MANYDPKNDTTPVLEFDQPHLPSVSALRTAIAASGVTASYPSAFLDTATKNDLIYVARVHGISVTGL